MFTFGSPGTKCLFYFYAYLLCKLREECDINIWLVRMFYTVHFFGQLYFNIHIHI